jgi:OmcA/MtrC family decaheme c-type cytochrome
MTKKVVTTDFSVTATGVTEVAAGSFGAGHDVVISYTADFVMPAVYPPPLNDSPDIDESLGKWAGKPIVPGTYTFGIWANRAVTANPSWTADATAYTASSLPATKDFLVGSATAIVPYTGISSAENCNKCHGDLVFHGGARRSFNACILCHGTAGAEDNPQYLSPGAPATRAETINYRSLMHKVHMGRELPDVKTFGIVTLSGSKPYPNNFSLVTFENNLYSAEPNETKACSSCHGANNTAWKVPADRSHPTQQGAPMQAWRASCTSCHNTPGARAHVEANSPGGNESCSVCHGPSREFSVDISHKEW